MLKGLLIGLAVGAIVGGISGYAQEGVGGILKGALSGAKDGALMGAAFGGLGGFGAGLGSIGQCSTAINTLFNVSSVISVGMQGFDMLALGDMTMMRLSKDFGFNYNGGQIAAANAKAHSNPFYNALQIGTGMTAVFTGGYKSTAKCFIAGTLVLTANGVVAIEMIKAGDLVYAADEDSLEVSLKPVLETYVRETTDLVHITVNGEEIVSTFDHPYYVKGKGFVNAVDLCIGYELIDNSGNTLVVEQIFREVLYDKTAKVYNLNVEDSHTYFVGECAVCVHNSECGIQENGYVDAKKVAEDPSEFTGKNINDYANEMKQAGYEFKIKTSTRSRSGAQKIVVENGSNTRNISQLQVSPGGGRHGSQPYVKISTTDQGIIKVVTGNETMYRTDGLETANIIFTEK